MKILQHLSIGICLSFATQLSNAGIDIQQFTSNFYAKSISNNGDIVVGEGYDTSIRKSYVSSYVLNNSNYNLQSKHIGDSSQLNPFGSFVPVLSSDGKVVAHRDNMSNNVMGLYDTTTGLKITNKALDDLNERITNVNKFNFRVNGVANNGSAFIATNSIIGFNIEQSTTDYYWEKSSNKLVEFDRDDALLQALSDDGKSLLIKRSKDNLLDPNKSRSYIWNDVIGYTSVDDIIGVKPSHIYDISDDFNIIFGRTHEVSTNGINTSFLWKKDQGIEFYDGIFASKFGANGKILSGKSERYIWTKETGRITLSDLFTDNETSISIENWLLDSLSIISLSKSSAKILGHVQLKDTNEYISFVADLSDVIGHETQEVPIPSSILLFMSALLTLMRFKKTS